MWIFCAGMKRAGSTLQYQLVSHLVEGAGRGSRMPWSPASEFPGVRRRHAGSHEWRVFKVHECSPEIAEEVRDRDARALSTVRDLRDVIASQMLMLGASFDQLWSAGFLEECVEHHTAWTALPGVAVTRYEVMIADPVGHTKQIAAQLDIALTGSQAAAISAEYSLEKQRARIANADAASYRRVRALDKELSFDPHTLLHRNHINSGRAGVWAQILSEDERRRVEEAFGGWLVAHGYPVG
jgi:hypothetical protein